MLNTILAISPDTIVQIAGVTVAAASIIIAHAIQRSRDRKIARRDIYQKLEFASVELFRFEADHLDLIRPIWEEGRPLPPKGTAEYVAIMNYICQVLNLFELAIKFRNDKTMPPDIFGSWVAWFYLLLRAPGFPPIWEETKWNYLPQLRKVMDGGLKLLKTEPKPIKQEGLFYEYVSFHLRCNVVQGWTAADEDNPLDDFWKSRQKTKRSKQMTEAEHITIKWITDQAIAPDLAKLFVANAGSAYISHGEIQEGRAINTTEWSPDLESKLTKEFNAASCNPPFQDANLIGAFQHEKLIGFMLLEFTKGPSGTFATMSDIIVDKHYRNMHIGEKLITWVAEQLQAKGITEMYAESNITNEVAHVFLKNMGFRTISKVFRKEIA
ncbi:MAG: GNAT family N-acetyltransferase [Saprospiraceae bacterium]|nr:GNAT family N-acetyltransferase [Candidatus Opimibacter iunctus]